MSKASEYKKRADKLFDKTWYPDQGASLDLMELVHVISADGLDALRVSHTGNLQCLIECGTMLTPKQALKMADWIYETFGDK